MIQLYTGVPGAGKSYKMVADLDAFLAKNPDVNLVSNIHNLQLPHEDFDTLMTDSFPGAGLTVTQRIERFFDYDFQAGLSKDFGGPIMYVIDECQLYFPRRTSLPVTEAYLQRHRHLGHYLYLATQSSKLLNSNIVALIEIEYYAGRRSVSFLGEFHYRAKSPQSCMVIKNFTVFPKKRIFGLYKSFDNEEISKPKKEMWRKTWPFAALLVVGFFFLRHFLDFEGRAERMTGIPRAHAEEVATVASPPPMMSVRPRSDPEAQQKIAELRGEVERLRNEMNNTERVFLTVVKQGKRRLVIDPDTQAIVDLRKIKHRVFCGEDGLGCYYDRPVNSGVKPAQTPTLNANPYGKPLSRMPVYSSPPPVKAERQTGFSTPFKPEEIPAPENPIKRVEF